MRTKKKVRKIEKTTPEVKLLKFAVGFQYKFSPLFLDKRGVFVEKCRKLFKPGTPLNITPDVPVGVTIQAKNPPVEIVFLPDKVILSGTNVFPVGQFEMFLKLFHKRLYGFFKECEPVYVGAVVELETTNKELLSMTIPTQNRNFRYNFKGVVMPHEKGVYRVALDTQKIANVSFDSIISILGIALKNIRKFTEK